MSVKKSTVKENFYNTLLNQLKLSTNLTTLRKKLGISRQKLNYHLRKLTQNGLIEKKGQGWYEVKESVKKSTMYGSHLEVDKTRGHAYIWKVRIPKIPENWDKRIDLLSKSNINYKLVGVLNNIPRIKVYGRKVWLCDNHIKIWERKSASYYGDNSKEAKDNAYDEILIVIKALENKLGIKLNPYTVNSTREHYAMIKNSLAKYHNQRGEVLRISDETGEWLLIDDSLGLGGELETIGKDAATTHDKLKNWFNDYKKNDFDITATDIKMALFKINQKIMELDKRINNKKEEEPSEKFIPSIPSYIN